MFWTLGMFNINFKQYEFMFNMIFSLKSFALKYCLCRQLTRFCNRADEYIIGLVRETSSTTRDRP